MVEKDRLKSLVNLESGLVLRWVPTEEVALPIGEVVMPDDGEADLRCALEESTGDGAGELRV